LSGNSELIKGTAFDKVPKLLARYVQFSQFKGADLDGGYFCSSCVYFYGGKNECAIVASKGESADGENSDHIAPYAMCALWKNPSMGGK
jgi:hypothetical protein